MQMLALLMDDKSEEEIWAPIAGWAYYEISNIGRVRSNRGGRSSRGWVILASQTITSGHRTVSLFNGEKRKIWPVHQLVANAFCAPRQSHHVLVRHLDGVPGNNRWWNLKWGTHKENHEDMVRHGRHRIGEAAPNSKLNEDQVRIIFNSTERNHALAARYGVSYLAISAIRNARSWKHVNGTVLSGTAQMFQRGPGPTKLTAEKAKEIFVSTDPTRDIARRMGVSESFVSHIRSGAKWADVTEGLDASDRKNLVAKNGRMLAQPPLRTITEEVIKQVFLSTESGAETANKFDVTEGYVSQIRSGKLFDRITKDLVAPPREKQNHKLTADIARQVFLDPRKPKFIAAEFGITRTLVSYIKSRKSWADATKDLTGVVSGSSVTRG